MPSTSMIDETRSVGRQEVAKVADAVVDESEIMIVPLGLIEKALSLAAWCVCAALFLTVGWTALRPADPLGAVSLWAHTHSLTAWIQTAALGGVGAAIGTLIIGKRLPDAGVFAAALGLAAVNLRGSSAGSLLIGYESSGAASQAGLAGFLIVETVAWFSVIVVAIGVGGMLHRWCFQGRESDDTGGQSDTPTSPDVGDSMMLSALRGSDGGPASADQPAWIQGVKQLAVTAAVALIMLRLLSGGTTPGLVRHGQVYFAVAAAFYVGVLAGRRWYPTSSALWGCVAVPLVACIGYCVAWISLGSGSGPTASSHIPASMFLRALPLTYVSVGTAAVMAAFWFTLRWPRPVRSVAIDSPRRR